VVWRIGVVGIKFENVAEVRGFRGACENMVDVLSLLGFF
jgi:hypothetical protein